MGVEKGNLKGTKSCHQSCLGYLSSSPAPHQWRGMNTAISLLFWPYMFISRVIAGTAMVSPALTKGHPGMMSQTSRLPSSENFTQQFHFNCYSLVVENSWIRAQRKTAGVRNEAEMGLGVFILHMIQYWYYVAAKFSLFFFLFPLIFIFFITQSYLEFILMMVLRREVSRG